MFRAAFIAILLLPVPGSVFAQTGLQDYASQLLKLTTLSDNKQYSEAIDGYRLLEAQPGTPGWLKAACEYEIAKSHAALKETDRAMSALSGAVRLGFDDCISPQANEGLRTILQSPNATQTLAGMKIAEGDFRELVWLQAEVLHAQHDGRMMIIENTNRLDHEATAVPQAQLPARPTTSAGVLYWRQQLLLQQRVQREFVMRADVQRIRHATMMGAITGVSSSAALQSARIARAAAESRRLEIRKRAFVPMAPASDQLKSCPEWNLAPAAAPSR